MLLAGSPIDFPWLTNGLFAIAPQDSVTARPVSEVLSTMREAFTMEAGRGGSGLAVPWNPDDVFVSFNPVPIATGMYAFVSLFDRHQVAAWYM